MKEENKNMLEYIKAIKVANGYVIQAKAVGVSTEVTFVSPKDEYLMANIKDAVDTLLGGKI